MMVVRRQVFALAFFCIFLCNGVVIGLPINDDICSSFQRSLSLFFREDISSVEIDAKYSYIRSYPSGGGIFLLSVSSDHMFPGCVLLDVCGDANLQIQVSHRVLHQNSRVTELTVAPNEAIDFGMHELVVTAVHVRMPLLSRLLIILDRMLPSGVDGFSTWLLDVYQRVGFSLGLCSLQRLVLAVEIFDWSSDNIGDAVIKRNEFLSWLAIEYPGYGGFSDASMVAYVTYPEIFIVEHWTFLYKEWEMRVCYHVMIPPHDWSQLCLRRRGALNPLLAAYRESGGTIYEIPLDEYPILFGY